MRIVLAALIITALAACSTPKKKSDSASKAKTSAPVVTKESKKADKASSDAVGKEVCESGKDSRSLEIHKKGAGCELSYSKFGKSSVVSSSQNGTHHCESSLEKIAKKLEADNFKCTKN